MITEAHRAALLQADRTRNVGPITLAIMDALTEIPDASLLDIEQVFREWRCQTFLVAWPADKCRPGVAKHRDGTPAKFALWICVNGEADMRAQVAKFGLTVDENRAALAECGFNMIG